LDDVKEASISSSKEGNGGISRGRNFVGSAGILVVDISDANASFELEELLSCGLSLRVLYKGVVFSKLRKQ
jgi:hypothetical protein